MLDVDGNEHVDKKEFLKVRPLMYQDFLLSARCVNIEHNTCRFTCNYGETQCTEILFVQISVCI